MAKTGDSDNTTAECLVQYSHPGCTAQSHLHNHGDSSLTAVKESEMLAGSIINHDMLHSHDTMTLNKSAKTQLPAPASPLCSSHEQRQPNNCEGFC